MTPTAILRPLLACCLLVALSACGDERSSSSNRSAATPAPVPATAPADVDAAAATPGRPAGAPKQGSCTHVAGEVDLCTDHSAPRFALRWTSDGGASWSAKSFDVEPLLWSPMTSLQQGLLAAVGGGDGATLQPFEIALRSDDLGETWQTFELPRFDEQMAYVAGSVVTTDGRMLTLLPAFSDDAPGWEAHRQHGLYVSDGSDWTEFSPILPEFTPLLNHAPPGESALQELSATTGPNPVIRVRTWDDQVYVTTDDAESFDRIRMP